MAGRTAWILGDQLSADNPALDGADRVLLVESRAKLASGPFHRQKLHLVLSAMRHYAAELAERGLEVDYRRARSLATGLRAHVREHRPDSVGLLRPNSHRALERLAELDRVEIVDGTLFLSHPDEFAAWADGRKQLRMENFYRRQRERFGLLMNSDGPLGGRWNYDAENREPPPRDRRPPRPYRPREDAIDAEVRADLDAMEIETWGEDGPRLYAATHSEARRALDRFVGDRLADFGPYQDAILAGEESQFMWHSLISAPLNLGLLDPLDCARAAEAALDDGAPLASVEGFVRQLIGWREYVHGLYWYVGGGEWERMNALRARADLPAELWSGETPMRCVSELVGKLERTAYAHHIERLMVAGNLTLLLGVEPRRAYDWFHHAFIDGYEWVMAPNVLGMATWADGGRMMSKPYAASGRYVDRMSDLCGECAFRPGERTGDDACPFTTLYWDFLDRNRKRLESNRRLAMQYRNLDRIEAGELREIRSRARALRRDGLGPNRDRT